MTKRIKTHKYLIHITAHENEIMDIMYYINSILDNNARLEFIRDVEK